MSEYNLGWQATDLRYSFDLNRGEAIQGDGWVLGTQLTQQIDVPLQLEFWMHPALHQHPRPPYGFQL